MKKLILFATAMMALVSCSKKDPEPEVSIDSRTVELKYDKTHQFVLSKGAEPVTASTFTWKSSDEKVGTVDGNGNFKGRKIGETKITGTSTTMGNVESTITIVPYTKFLTEPVVQWGADMATVKSKEKRKLSASLTTADWLVYEPDNASLQYVIYIFEAGKLISSVVIFTSTNAVVDESVTFFKERYPNIEADKDAAYLINDENTFGIILSINSSVGWNAEYVPLKKGGKKDAVATEKIQKALKSLNIN